MEERANMNGLGLARNVRREKFWYFSGILWLSRASTRTKFPHSYQERWLILSHWLTYFLGPQVPTPNFSGRLSLTVVFPWLSLTPICFLLWGLAFPRLLPVSEEISSANPLCEFHAKTGKGILWLALTHIHTHWTNAHHCATGYLMPYPVFRYILDI